MRTKGSLRICAVVVACCVHTATAQLTPAPTVTVLLEAPRIVFAKPTAQHSLEIAKRSYLRQQYVLDATGQERGGKIWCKRGAGESYTDVFRERDVPLKELGALQGATLSQITALLGEPVVMEGPIDFGGTVLWKWRAFNGKAGAATAAVEAAAGFKGGSSTNVLFLVISAAKKSVSQ
jgi:hypothetical protein